MIHLSKRLMAVASLVKGSNILLDVGTDHAYIPVYLVSSQHIRRALAMDINAGPIKRARQNTERYGLGEKIDTRLSDGLKNYQKGEADSIIIAGMGGLLMKDILSFACENDRLTGKEELILQPQSDIDIVRHWLHDYGYCITHEDMVKDAGKYYTMFRAIAGKEQYDDELSYVYGQKLIEQKHPVLIEFLHHQLEVKKELYETLKNTDSQGARNYMPVLAAEINGIISVQKKMEACNESL